MEDEDDNLELNYDIIDEELENDIEEVVIEKNKKKEKKESGNYVDNEKFIEEFLKWKDNIKIAEEKGTSHPKIPEYMGYTFLKISQGVSRMRNRKTGRCCFIDYSYIQDMILDGVEQQLKYCKNFNPEITRNPFAFFTMIVYHSFLRKIWQEKKHQYVKYKLTEISNILDEHELLELEDGTKMDLEPYSNLSIFIDKFESDVKEKKSKIKKKKDEINKKNIEDLF